MYQAERGFIQQSPLKIASDALFIDWQFETQWATSLGTPAGALLFTPRKDCQRCHDKICICFQRRIELCLLIIFLISIGRGAINARRLLDLCKKSLDGLWGFFGAIGSCFHNCYFIKKEALENFKWLSQECHCDECLSVDTTLSSACKFSGVFISSYSILNTIVCFVLFPPLFWKNYLSFSVFLCAPVKHTEGGGWKGGAAKSNDREKA